MINYAPLRVVNLNAGGNLQTAINDAIAGDAILLEPGATFTGNFTLPDKANSIPVYLSTQGRANLPRRIGDSDVASLPKLLTTNTSSALKMNASAENYYIEGIHFNSDVHSFQLLELGLDETTLAAVPRNATVMKCAFMGNATVGCRRGMTLNCTDAHVQGCHFKDFKHASNDTQAILSWNSFGPFTIVDNFLEAAGECIMFGGAVPTVTDARITPSNIVISRNHFSKPVSWINAGWLIKNLLEMKHARDFLVDSNLFEYSWQGNQSGDAILLTVRTEGTSVPWAVVKNGTITNNIIRHCGNGISMLGFDDSSGLGKASNFLIKDNIFYDISPTWHPNGGSSRLFGFTKNTDDVTIENNITQGYSALFICATNGSVNQRLIMRNNLLDLAEFGFVGDGFSNGTPVLNAYFPGYTITGNIFYSTFGLTITLTGNTSHNSVTPMNFIRPAFNDGITGFLNPNSQSPSIRRLSRIAGNVLSGN